MCRYASPTNICMTERAETEDYYYDSFEKEKINNGNYTFRNRKEQFPYIHQQQLPDKINLQLEKHYSGTNPLKELYLRNQQTLKSCRKKTLFDDKQKSSPELFYIPKSWQI